MVSVVASERAVLPPPAGEGARRADGGKQESLKTRDVRHLPHADELPAPDTAPTQPPPQAGEGRGWVMH